MLQLQGADKQHFRFVGGYQNVTKLTVCKTVTTEIERLKRFIAISSFFPKSRDFHLIILIKQIGQITNAWIRFLAQP